MTNFPIVVRVALYIGAIVVLIALGSVGYRKGRGG
jgi:hypothetical protein